jgi:hypothetical protein
MLDSCFSQATGRAVLIQAPLSGMLRALGYWSGNVRLRRCADAIEGSLLLFSRPCGAARLE